MTHQEAAEFVRKCIKPVSSSILASKGKYDGVLLEPGLGEALCTLLDGYRAAARDSKARRETDLTPIYTCGGHGGYYDDDDEDFWCPMCHEHLGTHKGYATVCPRCGQNINSDSEPCYEYQEMYHNIIEWSGPEPGGTGDTNA